MKREINKKWMLAGGVLAVLAVIVGIVYLLTLPALELKSKVKVQINSAFEPLSIVEKVRDGNEADIKVDLNDFDATKIGEYVIEYKHLDKVYEAIVSVVDEKAPTFKISKGETDAGIDVDPKTLVSKIKDDSKTTVSFKKNYKFNKEGTVDVIVVVTDAHGNETEKETTVKVYPKDTEKPVIKGTETVTVNMGAGFDPLSNMSVTDNQTKNIKLKVVSNNVNESKAGTYKVVYEATDRSGNKATFTKEVTVIQRRATFAGENVVYLTFDDGPSYITPKILEILDRYKVKATFFVVGYNENYHNYIKEAYDKGHTIALHTYSHDYAIYASSETYFNDLQKISDLVYAQTGYRSPYVRFPGGSSNTISANYSKGIMTKLANELHNRGYEFYDWNVSSSDASGNGVPVQTIINSSTACSGGTAMILFHDAGGKETTAEALPKVIEHYLSLGYTFKGIDESTAGFHHGINN